LILLYIKSLERRGENHDASIFVGALLREQINTTNPFASLPQFCIFKLSVVLVI